jgi:hypothetical protein
MKDAISVYEPDFRGNLYSPFRFVAVPVVVPLIIIVEYGNDAPPLASVTLPFTRVCEKADVIAPNRNTTKNEKLKNTFKLDFFIE